jgi:glycine/D-amino acid oxidase-like deaminating enzyme/nitrite reductase/ring-hydroxylating ferredoxin subunit
MTSLWLDRSRDLDSDPLPGGAVDDLVVGAGITGLTTALLLARSGRRVAVVEARDVGAVATGNTTAKVSLLQGTKYSRLLHYQSRRVALAYLEANREGMAWLLRFCEDHGVDVQRRPAVTYAADGSELSSVRDEHAAATSVGLDVVWQDSLDVPFPARGATVLADQAQFDPMDALAALVEQLRAHGGTLHLGRRVRTVSLTGQAVAKLDDGSEVAAEHVVLATGTPVLDRGLYFAKLEPQRSYALAFTGATPPEGMYLSAGSDSRSVRDAPGPDGGTRLLVGGAGHSVGRVSSEREHVDRLREWTQEHFPGAVETHQWSAQDYRSHDAVPYVGRLPRGFGRIYLATGFDKWGMTNGVAAARAISGQILGQQPGWARTLGRRTTGPAGAAHIAGINLQVGLGAAKGAVERLTRRDADGVVPVCTHLGGPLHWNDCEESWDCPLHGSRFARSGEVLEGPATRPLFTRGH